MKLGPYEIEGSIGSGATGTVYRARDARGRPVAVKVLHRLSAEAVARFDRERRIHESLGEQAGFVPFLDAGEGPNGRWIAMPYLAGGTLRERLARGRLSIEESVRVATRIAQALGRAHALGVVHRDLKPENVLFTHRGADATPWGDPLVADLGLAKHFEGEATSTAGLSRSGELHGTAGYAPPEQMGDAKNAGPAADVFAIGAILHECLGGAPAFIAPSLVELLAKVEEGEHAPIATVRPETPPWLAAIVERCLETEPRRRFADATLLARALVARGRDARPARFGAATPLLVAIAFLAAALVLLAIAVRRTQTAAPPPPGAPTAGPETPPPPPPPLDASLAKAPPWFFGLDPASRPKRLPPGIAFGARSGEYVNEKDESVLVYVEPGPFVVGPRPRSTAGFFIGKFEVTNYQFASFVAATGHRTRAEELRGGHVIVENTDGKEPNSYWRFPRGQGALETPAPARHPALQIWWSDAVAYASWAGLRLPTLDEWQKAAGWDRFARRERKFPWGDDGPATTIRPVGDLADRTFLAKWLEPPSDAARYDDHFERAAPVDAFAESRSSYGAFEMGGNAAEWIAAVYEGKRTRDVHESLIDRLAGAYYLVVGGSFGTYPPEKACRVTAEPRQPRQPREDLGFRICRSDD